MQVKTAENRDMCNCVQSTWVFHPPFGGCNSLACVIFKDWDALLTALWQGQIIKILPLDCGGR